MPQEVQLASQQGQISADDKLTAITNRNKTVEKKQTRTDEPQKSLKRTAPSDMVGQGDAKRKATQGSKKPVDKLVDGATLRGSDPNFIAANAVTLLSTVATVQAVDNSHHFAENLSAAASLANSVSSPIAVAPLSSSQQTGISGMTPNANMVEFLNNATAAQVQAQAQGQIQEANSTGKRSSTSRNLSNDERRQRRLLRNRVAAKECRRKKKAYVADLEEKVTRLEEENIRLQKEVEELSSKTSQIEEYARLQKEVEELKTKLALCTGQADVKKELKANPKGDTNKNDSTESKLLSLKS
ncbi:3727_t:CDS:1 [Acaulospora colombiana]|uniref:3727_t:CDS:1 n=1 Tax=Acaulospora colombiana TaxID=27376 RepID=A0ACA9K542_9GLOM|nr:3727_t:CDS:1 [Acaulospora colombiana]